MKFVYLKSLFVIQIEKGVGNFCNYHEEYYLHNIEVDIQKFQRFHFWLS